MFEKISHFKYTHIQGTDNMPADIMSRLPERSKELPDISAHMPLKSVEAVQTRSAYIRISRDLIMMAQSSPRPWRRDPTSTPVKRKTYRNIGQCDGAQAY